ncbi:lipoxygenase 6, chloroplastic isoform X2 [Coffea arabica]|uniref:Lipoxygenase 6, chloroplastic isoform X2 n=1 Tax=Coffea arabica TaxID=13443 RepID=A0ABM4W3L7_COFAR
MLHSPIDQKPFPAMFTAQPSPCTLSSSTIQHVPTVRRSETITGGGRRIGGFTRQKANNVPGFQSTVQSKHQPIRTVISSEGAKLVEKSQGSNGSLASSSVSGGMEVRAAVTIRRKMKENITDKLEDQWESFMNGIGRGILLQLISEDIDPITRSGKSAESYVRGFPKPSNHPFVVEYAANFRVPNDFGRPGAILITNFLDKEFYLVEIVVHNFSPEPQFFPANTWIHSRKDNPESRIIFKNQAYLPSQTPDGIKDLRREDLLSIRGNGKGERKMHERIYDYAPYNDLGNPDKSDELARPSLGGNEQPYPRRCRTGRRPTKKDPLSESRIEKPHPIYVPRDEAFEEIKQNTFSAGRLKALLHNLIPLISSTLSSSDNPFTCFSEIDKLYNDGVLLKDEDQKDVIKNQFLTNLMNQVFTVGGRLLKYEIPAVIKRDRFAWLRDNEFARQALAGVNPVNIELLKELPILSKLDPAVYGPPESAITRELIEQELFGMSVEKALEDKRLFILDYHDMLLPFIEGMNSLPGRKAYASRTIFFYTPTGILRPIIIELSLPPSSNSPRKKHVFVHGHDATTHWIWKQAKAHVCSNDAGIHQLVNHWGMAVEDPSMPCGVKLAIEDYPYAADGLLIWSAIKELVASYVDHYYSDPSSITSDVELQAWWNEIKNKGHFDKRDETWWPNLGTKEDLSSILTIMIWVASGQHAAINFGQYPFGGYVPNRPTLMRKLIPGEGDPAYEKFLLNPVHTFLSSLPTQLQATKIMAVQDTLSTHSPDEEYLHQLHNVQSTSIKDPEVLKLFENFSAKLEDIERTINERNRNIALKNRSGAGIPPYELLLPSSGPGVTGRGIPNSISI